MTVRILAHHLQKIASGLSAHVDKAPDSLFCGAAHSSVIKPAAQDRVAPFYPLKGAVREVCMCAVAPQSYTARPMTYHK